MPPGRVSPSEAKTPILKSAQKSIRTELEADAIATALIENLHCLQGRVQEADDNAKSIMPGDG
jgi:hypothetical protein